MTKNYILAVSGGVDSVVLLDKMSRLPGLNLVVAHFDHGIREESFEDEAFVRALAKKYNLPYETRRANLGAGASEEKARNSRYEFLNNVAKKYQAQIVTAHHADDLVETVAINLSRGTGWRGLAVFDSAVHRPLLSCTKQELVNYAQARGLDWREDRTNQDEKYLRNRLRRQTIMAPVEIKHEIRALHARQRQIRLELEAEARQLVGWGPTYSRYLFANMGDAAAMECLWVIFAGSLTRPQLRRVLHAIKVARPGSYFQAGMGKKVQFSTRHFTF